MTFVIDDLSRKIVVRSVSSKPKTDILPLRTLHMVAWHVSNNLTGLVDHSNGVSNCVALASRTESLKWVEHHLLDPKATVVATPSLSPKLYSSPNL